MGISIGDALDLERPRCSQCEVNLAEKNYKKPGTYLKKCRRCYRGYSRHNTKKWAVHKKDYCENTECTATISIPQQLTVDHMDGDKNNNDPSNLMTLCHNCHALKTFQNRDFLNIALREYDKMVG